MRFWPLLILTAACAAGGGADDDDVVGDDDPTNPDGGDPCCDGRPGQPDAGDGDDPDAPAPSECTDGLGAWTGNDNVAPSADPPCGLLAAQVPQFVNIGFDDNAYSGLEGSAGTGGMTWAVEMLGARQNPDGSDVTGSFYLTSIYADQWQSESPTFVKRAWNAAMVQGHEIGNHTRSHSHGMAFDAATWMNEIQQNITFISQPFDPNEVNFSPDASKGIGVDPDDIVGFRTPFLEYNDATLSVEKQLGFHYDCSIEDGYQYDQDGTNYLWPYTLDNGSPGHEILVEWGSKPPITPHPGLWEMPVHPVIVPPDDRAAEYGIPPGLRAKLHALQSWFDVDSGKITGFDYNLWVSFRMTKAEFLATLKHTLDLRLEGNRAPFMFGAHTDYYSSKYTAVPNATLQERQEAIEEFLDYALSKSMVRVKSNREILEWVRNPDPL
jgi:peptidoglycan/xylan/chitin deacetylase (PgdA/CDA1 family)